MLIVAKRYGIVLSLIVFLAFSLIVSCSNESKKDENRLTGETDLTVLFTAQMFGNIRSCGCEIHDIGGLGRMATFVKRTRAKAPNLLFLGSGDDFSLDLSFSKNKANLIMECYEIMGLDAFTPGEREYIFGLDYLTDIAAVSSFDFLVSNLVYSENGKRVFEPAYIIKEFDTGLKVGITGVMGDSISFPDYIDCSGFRFEPAVETLKSVGMQMKKDVDFLIVLSHMDVDNTRDLLERVPFFDLAVTGHGKSEFNKIEKVGKTMMIGARSGGTYMGKLVLEISKKREVGYARVQMIHLEGDIKIDNEVKRIFRSHDIALTDKEKENANYR